MPFGLSNSPAVFQTLVNDVLRDVVNRFVFVYLDDILIFSQNERDHIQHVRLVLQWLLENRLFAKLEKCEFHAQSVPFLGFILSPEGIRMDPAKVEAVANWPTPDNRKAVQRFLGFANFYRRFIRGFSQIALPLTNLTSTRQRFCWSEQALEAFEKLKLILLTLLSCYKLNRCYIKLSLVNILEMVFVFIEILFKILLFKGGVLIYAEHCIYIWVVT